MRSISWLDFSAAYPPGFNWLPGWSQSCTSRCVAQTPVKELSKTRHVRSTQSLLREIRIFAKMPFEQSHLLRFGPIFSFRQASDVPRLASHVAALRALTIRLTNFIAFHTLQCAWLDGMRRDSRSMASTVNEAVWRQPSFLPLLVFACCNSGANLKRRLFGFIGGKGTPGDVVQDNP